MRITRALPLMVAAFAFTACGSSSTKKNPDAKPAADAAPLFDAPPAGLTGFGQACTLATPNCPTSAPDCQTGKQGATTGLCTLSCGQSAWTGDPNTQQAPTGGDAICMNAYPADATHTGTPGCYYYAQDQTDTTKADWDCGIACGSFNGQPLGNCPTGLTCDIATGQTYGFCE